MSKRSHLDRLERLEKRSGIDANPTLNLELYELQPDGTWTKLPNPTGRASNGGPTLRMLIVDAVDGRPISNTAPAADGTLRKEAA